MSAPGALGAPAAYLGRHLLIELYGCPPDHLNEVGRVERALLLAAERCGATVLGHQFHRFEPQGVSGVVVVAESHLSVHTWPEHGYAAADVFSCGASLRPEAAIPVFAEALGAQKVGVQEIRRGVLEEAR